MSSHIRTILITGAGGAAGRSLCRQLRLLRNAHLRIIATDVHEVETCADIFLTGPAADSPDLIDFLRSVIASYDVDLVLPTVQDELPTVAAAAAELGNRVILSDPVSADVCHDKLLTALRLDDQGIAVPWTRAGSQAPVKYPLVVKPRVSHGGRGVSVVDSADELPELDESVITQGFVGGVEYCPQVYRSPVDGSVTTVVLQKMKLRDGRVGNADSVLRIARSLAPDVAELAEATVVALELYGPVDIDIRRGKDGTPVVLDVNARFGPHSACAPELLRQLLADAALVVPEAPAAPTAPVGAALRAG